MIDVKNEKRTALALGSFDGLHKGHMQVMLAAAKQSKNGLCPKLVRFDVHPASVLCGKAPARLLTDEQRRAILKQYDVQEEVLSFSEIRNLSPERFVKEILADKLRAAFVSCGFNYRFGKNGEGTCAMLQSLCAENGIDCFVAPEVLFENAAVSATRIRACLQEGQVEQANAMLTRPFYYDFEVVGGDRRGRLMGTPTINQYFPDGFLVPKYGVYASFVEMDGNIFPAVTNIGLRPTFGGMGERSETWIIDFSGDLYGQHIPVHLLSFLRNEVKFDSMDALRQQILQDAEAGKNAVEKFFKKVEKNS